MEQTKEEIANLERAAKIKTIDEIDDKYMAAFVKVQEYQAQRDEYLEDYLEVQDSLLENTLTEILVSAEQDGDMEAAYDAALAMKHLLFARLYAVKFLDNNKDSAVLRVAAEFKLMEENLVHLDISLQNRKRREYLNIVIASKVIYIEYFDKMKTAIQNRNTIINTELDKWGPEIAALVEEVKQSVKAEQDDHFHE